MQKTYKITPGYFFTKDGDLRYDGRPVADYPSFVHDIPSEERPREKLLAQGPGSLTTRELAILLLVTGTTKESVVDMANRLVNDYGERNIFAEQDPEKLSKELDIPLVKACQIVAVGELGRRIFDRSKTSSVTIRNAKDVYEHLVDMRNLHKEHFRALYLNSHSRVIRDQVISIGTVDSSLIFPRDVFNPAIDVMAKAVVIAHNHPSGELAPSAEDVRITEQLVQAGKILGIHVLDHVIIAKDGFVSVPANYN